MFLETETVEPTGHQPPPPQDPHRRTFLLVPSSWLHDSGVWDRGLSPGTVSGGVPLPQTHRDAGTRDLQSALSHGHLLECPNPAPNVLSAPTPVQPTSLTRWLLGEGGCAGRWQGALLQEPAGPRLLPSRGSALLRRLEMPREGREVLLET